MSQRKHQTESEGRQLCWHCVLPGLHALEAVEAKKDTNMNILTVTCSHNSHPSALPASISSWSYESGANNHRSRVSQLSGYCRSSHSGSTVEGEVEAEEEEQEPEEEEERKGDKNTREEE